MTQNSKISEDKFRSLMMNTKELVMDVGSVVDGEAVKNRSIDCLGGLSDAISKLYGLIESTEKLILTKNLSSQESIPNFA